MMIPTTFRKKPHRPTQTHGKKHCQEQHARKLNGSTCVL